MPGRYLQAGRASAFSANAGPQVMPVRFSNNDRGSDDDPVRAQRFRDAALPYLDDAYTLARYLLRDANDAEDAAQECYLRALRHFDSYRGRAMKPWLLTILRNVCNSEFARRGNRETPADLTEQEEQATSPIWREPESSPET